MTVVTSNIHAGIVAWAGGQAYAVGNRRSNSGNAYQCTRAGTSGLSGGPTGTGTNITDGSCRWEYLSAVGYTSIADWLNSIPATRTDAYTGLLWNDAQITTAANTPFAYIGGHAGGSSSNLITLTTAPGESFRDAGGALAYNAAAGVSFLAPNTAGGTNYLWIDDDWVVIDGLQLKDPLSTSSCSLIGGGGSNVTIQNCLVDGYSQGGGARIIGFGASSVVALLNSAVWDRSGTYGNPTCLLPAPGTVVVNNTFIFTTYVAGAACLDASNNNTAQSETARNNIFINYDVPMVAVSPNNQWASDHNGYTASSYAAGNTGTDSGGSVFSLVVANEFVGSITSNVRKRWGARCVDAGAADTTDIPSATDIFGVSRPQGAAWDIGADELVPPHQIGTARARGKAAGTFLTQFATKGRGEASGVGLLAAGISIAARSSSTARGSGSALLSVPLTASRGKGGSRGSLGPGLYSLPLGGAASRSAGSGQSGNPATAFLSARSLAAAHGSRTVAIVTRLFTARGASSSRGSFSVQSFTIPLAAAGTAASRGLVPLRIALNAAASRGMSAGRASVSAGTALRSLGRASASALLGAPGLGLRTIGKAASQGIAGLGLGLASARGFAAARGQAIEGAVEALIGTSSSAAHGAFGPFTGALALAAVGTARGSGSTNSIAGLSIVARGAASSRGTQGTQIIYGAGSGAARGAGGGVATRPLSGFGRASGHGRNIPLNSASAVGLASSRGTGQLSGQTSFVPAAGTARARGAATISATAFQQGRGSGAVAGVIPASMTFFARGGAVSHSTAGGVASLPFSGAGSSVSSGAAASSARTALQATGISAAAGTASSALSAVFAAIGSGAASGASAFGTFGMIAARARATGRGRAVLTAAVSVASTGRSAARGIAGLAVNLPARGFAVASGRVIGGPVALLAGAGRAAGRASGALLPLWLLVGRGFAAVGGRLHDRADVAARSSGAASGQAAFFLTLNPARGRAGSHGLGMVLPLHLLNAAGVARGRGVIGAPAFGTAARGMASSRGSLYRHIFIAGSGGGAASGTAIISPWHFIVPDETGALLSTLSELPVFDPALVSDRDYYVFDWGERAGVASDPIVSATVTATPNTISVGDAEVVGDHVRVLVGGSVVGTYALRCSVTLLSGRVLHWSVPVQIEKV